MPTRSKVGSNSGRSSTDADTADLLGDEAAPGASNPARPGGPLGKSTERGVGDTISLNVSARVSAATHEREWRDDETPGRDRDRSERVSGRVSGPSDGDGHPAVLREEPLVSRPAFDALDRSWSRLV